MDRQGGGLGEPRGLGWATLGPKKKKEKKIWALPSPKKKKRFFFKDYIFFIYF